MLFSEKWLKNHPKFLLDFLMYIDVLMLCSFTSQVLYIIIIIISV